MLNFFKVNRSFRELHDGLSSVVRACPEPFDKHKAHAKVYQKHYTEVP